MMEMLYGMKNPLSSVRVEVFSQLHHIGYLPIFSRTRTRTEIDAVIVRSTSICDPSSAASGADKPALFHKLLSQKGIRSDISLFFFSHVASQ